MDNKAHVIQYTYYIYVLHTPSLQLTFSQWAMASYKATESFVSRCG